jgi:hypothetical protein
MAGLVCGRAGGRSNKSGSYKRFPARLPVSWLMFSPSCDTFHVSYRTSGTFRYLASRPASAQSSDPDPLRTAIRSVRLEHIPS